MKKILCIAAVVVCAYACSHQDPETSSSKVKTVTVVDVATGDTIQIKFTGNPGVADQAYKK
jgi:endonuclease YncB( thermonuclease family)